MFMVGAAPALLVLYIRRSVPESPDWVARKKEPSVPLGTILRNHLPLTFYVIIMMTAVNFFIHRTQDLYPSAFLGGQHKLDHATISTIAIIYNIGAMIGGLAFGTLSQRIGRRTAIVVAALVALPVIPLWALSNEPFYIGLGAFLMQICVQGAWGVIPDHLNELSPPAIRGTFPGVTYQLGNLLAAANATIQSSIADHMDHNYSWAVAGTAGIVAVVIAVLVGLGREGRDVQMGAGAAVVRA